MKPSIPNLNQKMEYLNPIQSRLSSIMLCLLALSTIFILFVIYSPSPFSIINQDPPPILDHNKISTFNSSTLNNHADESATPWPPSSSGSTGTRKENPIDQHTELSKASEVVTSTPPSSSGSRDVQQAEPANRNQENPEASISSEPSVAEESANNSTDIQKGDIQEDQSSILDATTRPSQEPNDQAKEAAPQSSSEPVSVQQEERTSQNRENHDSVPSTSQCDLFSGRWVRDARGSIYTNETCKTLPVARNCGRYGKEQGHVYWRWKPDGCELPIFDPELFLSIARGKKLMFIGDSLARNMMESLLCLLSQAETPINTYKDPKDPKDKHRTWYFPAHDFTLMVIWTEFLVETNEIIINGTATDTYNINLDKPNPVWGKKLKELKYAVINHGNWFTRKTYIYRKKKLIGCVHCYGEKIPLISMSSAIRMAMKSAFRFINKCKECEDLLTVMRTYSMSHFEHGSWLTGGYCNRTEPLRESELNMENKAWEFRRIQMEEMERARREGKRRIELMDVTKAMMLRADAHPGRHWYAKSASDCLHWCLPGPIDMWSEVLLEIMKKNR